MKRLLLYLIFFGGIAYVFLGCGAVPRSMMQLNAVNLQNMEKMKEDIDNLQTEFGNLYLDYSKSKRQIVLREIVSDQVYPLLEEAGFTKEIFVAEVLELIEDSSRNETEIMNTVMEERTTKRYPAYERLKWGLSLQGDSMSTLNQIDYNVIFESVDNSLPGFNTLVDRYRADKAADDVRKRDRRDKTWAENNRLRKEAEERNGSDNINDNEMEE
jgi:hypothetical protein